MSSSHYGDLVSKLIGRKTHKKSLCRNSLLPPHDMDSRRSLRNRQERRTKSISHILDIPLPATKRIRGTRRTAIAKSSKEMPMLSNFEELFHIPKFPFGILSTSQNPSRSTKRIQQKIN
mmetsp:Transcript_13697/g.12141  ORF Transcript_13697/g.12141 Transcript_13697/m.12141 type:complete len:119 (+) Transcript_13697:1-357(+)